jgi:hypothetical protein
MLIPRPRLGTPCAGGWREKEQRNSDQAKGKREKSPADRSVVGKWRRRNCHDHQQQPGNSMRAHAA